MSEQKTIEQYADEYTNEVTSGCCTPKGAKYTEHGYTVCQCELTDSYLAGAAKQKELDAEKIKDYEQALEFECGNRCSDLNPCNAKEVLKKWGAV